MTGRSCCRRGYLRVPVLTRRPSAVSSFAWRPVYFVPLGSPVRRTCSWVSSRRVGSGPRVARWSVGRTLVRVGVPLVSTGQGSSLGSSPGRVRPRSVPVSLPCVFVSLPHGPLPCGHGGDGCRVSSCLTSADGTVPTLGRSGHEKDREGPTPRTSGLSATPADRALLVGVKDGLRTSPRTWGFSPLPGEVPDETVRQRKDLWVSGEGPPK